MGRLTTARPAEAYEVAAIQALQTCTASARTELVYDDLLALLAMSVLRETGALHGEAMCASVLRIANAIRPIEASARFLNRAAAGFAGCSDDQSAGELLEAAAIRRLRSGRS